MYKITKELYHFNKLYDILTYTSELERGDEWTEGKEKGEKK